MYALENLSYFCQEVDCRTNFTASPQKKGKKVKSKKKRKEGNKEREIKNEGKYLASIYTMRKEKLSSSWYKHTMNYYRAGKKKVFLKKRCEICNY